MTFKELFRLNEEWSIDDVLYVYTNKNDIGCMEISDILVIYGDLVVDSFVSTSVFLREE